MSKILTEPCVFKLWRENLGLSQRRVAEILGVSRRSVIGWEQGTQPIKIGTRLLMEAVTAATQTKGGMPTLRIRMGQWVTYRDRTWAVRV